MRNFETHWVETVEANPGFSDLEKRFTINVAEFKRVLRRAYEQGAKDSNNELPRPLSLFETIFGKHP